MPFGAFQVRTPPKAVTKKRTMEPSIRPRGALPITKLFSASPLISAPDMGGDDDESKQQQQLPVVRDDEPYLYNIPRGLFPVYRPLPIVANIFVALLGLAASAVHTWKKINFIRPLLILNAGIKTGDIKKILHFFSKALVAAAFSHVFLQECFSAPSRASIQTLQQDYFLPSSLSRYEQIKFCLPEENQVNEELNDDSDDLSSKVGVSFLRYENPNATSNQKKIFRAMYVNHGFGASSLSWLPALPSLVNRVGARVGIGHDAAGFGFTDRPKDISFYTSKSSAIMGLNLLNKEIETDADNNNDGAGGDMSSPERPPPAVLLLGHSMGSIATLHMALGLPNDIQKDIILVAPALGIAPSIVETRRTNRNGVSRRLLRTIRQAFQKVFVYAPFTYILRRTVGTEGFWKKGLLSVWGDRTLLSESDVLRFQWPSIGSGWEKGLINFSRAQLLPKQHKDTDLLEKVLALPNTTVSVIQGTSDVVMKKSVVQKFFEPYKSQVRIWELENRGHDPFEEKPEEFVSTVMQILESS